MTNSLNLQSIDQETALSLSRFFLKAGQNILLVGQSGIGKSSIVFQAATELGFNISSINLSTVERVDLQGYPINDGSELLQYKSPAFLPPLKEGQKPDTVLIFDEVDKCDRDITAPLLEILQRRSINGKKLNVVGCVLTSNLPEEQTFSNPISSALLDRCSKFLLSFSLDKWLLWARSNNIHSLILSFLQSNPEYACGSASAGSKLASPTPRGWTMASDGIIQATKQKLRDIESITAIVSGFVGYEAGLRFKTWYQHFRSFEPAILSMLETGSCSIDFSELTPTEKLVFTISACHLARLRFIQESKKKPCYQSIERLCSFLVSNNVSLENQAVGFSNSFSMELVVSPKYRLYQCKPFFDLTSAISLPNTKKSIQ